MDFNSNKKENYLITLKKALKASFVYIFLFSAAINLIMLILPIYSLQVFDRVQAQQSLPYLISLGHLYSYLSSTLLVQ